ncbi:hypothetical protein ACPPVT_01760 [Angustibacter sp. McL0619]|uniref:hypothetical protein n=1 Tax=Angustibacter sp. McL0619 TaxID=3415676 RepID=UPI003CECECC0
MRNQYWMHFDARGDLLESARQCEAEVFQRWFGNTRAELDEEYGPYEADSIFLVIADAGDEVVAAVRLIAPGRSGFKALDDVAQAPWQVDGARSAAAAGLDLSTTWEVGTLCVRAGVAGSSRLSLALYHGLMTVAQVNGMSAFIAILDERVRRLLSSVGITTRPLPGVRTAPYLGSAHSTPVYSPFAAMLDAQRRDLPDAYRLVTLGIGLDGIVVPERAAFRRRERELVLDLAALDTLDADLAALDAGFDLPDDLSRLSGS